MSTASTLRAINHIAQATPPPCTRPSLESLMQLSPPYGPPAIQPRHEVSQHCKPWPPPCTQSNKQPLPLNGIPATKPPRKPRPEGPRVTRQANLATCPLHCKPWPPPCTQSNKQPLPLYGIPATKPLRKPRPKGPRVTQQEKWGTCPLPAPADPVQNTGPPDTVPQSTEHPNGNVTPPPPSSRALSALLLKASYRRNDNKHNLHH